MIRNTFTAISVIALFGIASCASVETSGNASIAPNEQRTISVGDSVVRVDLRRSLPNAFGRADVFGGTTDAGYIDLRYLGLNEEGNPVFHRQDVSMVSDETTMSRFGPLAAQANAQSNTNDGNTVIVNTPRADNVKVLSPTEMQFSIDLSESRIITVDDVTIYVISANGSSITYERR